MDIEYQPQAPGDLGDRLIASFNTAQQVDQPQRDNPQILHPPQTY